MEAKTYSADELSYLVETALRRQSAEARKITDFYTEEEILIALTDKEVGVSESVAKKVFDDYSAGSIFINSSPQLTKDGFIYVPSIGLYVAKEKSLFGKNHTQCNEILHSNNERMPTIPEEIEFLKYCKINFPEVYKEITEIRSQWRAEWLDADFKVENGNLVIYFHAFNSDGKIIKKKERLDKDTLMSDRAPGISIENWLDNSHTNQGLPSKNCRKGDSYYWCPDKYNNSVAGFIVYSGRSFFNCNRDPSNSIPSLGVRAVKSR
jgi:hypothetical protein